jgi:hypothetical protein
VVHDFVTTIKLTSNFLQGMFGHTLLESGAQLHRSLGNFVTIKLTSNFLQGMFAHIICESFG